MRRALVAAVLLVAAGALLVAWGDAMGPARPGEAGVVPLRGPAVARLDEANGTTVALFHVGHFHGGPAYVLAGDAREAVAARRVYLKADAEDWALVGVAPFAEAGLRERAGEAYAGPFEPVSPWPRLVPVFAGPALACAGLAWLAARGARPGLVAGAVAGAAGVALGAWGGSLGDGGVLVLLGLPAAGVVALVGALLLPRARVGFVAAALGCAAGAWTVLQAWAWFPSPPAV